MEDNEKDFVYTADEFTERLKIICHQMHIPKPSEEILQ